ncbi:ABC transporter ATP-binding protein [Ramlibacter sp. H39-3-26]|uniref:ABC transporter ATP-binding protein n=1 Tax=Curvibacter soli TaxID=3031331 RepID=UPI0023DC353E|nr:ABC transporter ATP-binding protein [Ramlibacter sp. H39-3-26]MDF1485820.1 ABC transporter ATP-binding protein [Ramlibacter sp. H39-3-26]
MTAPPLLALEGVEKRYASGTLALSDFSLAVGAREFVSLLGPSGCGKSTVLRMAAGLDAPGAGTLRRPGDAGTGFVFQEPTLMPWARVAANVALPLELAGLPRAECAARVHAALRTVGLEGFARAWPRELSGGMKMRASIARALVTRPRLLLMDEPFAALDEITRFRLNDQLLALWQAQGFTALFVTHSVFEAVYLSQRVVVMAARPGRVVADIAIDEPYPRTDALRATPRYAAWCAQVSGALREATDA